MDYISIDSATILIPESLTENQVCHLRNVQMIAAVSGTTRVCSQKRTGIVFRTLVKRTKPDCWFSKSWSRSAGRPDVVSNHFRFLLKYPRNYGRWRRPPWVPLPPAWKLSGPFCWFTALFHSFYSYVPRFSIKSLPIVNRLTLRLSLCCPVPCVPFYLWSNHCCCYKLTWARLPGFEDFFLEKKFWSQYTRRVRILTGLKCKPLIPLETDIGCNKFDVA